MTVRHWILAGLTLLVALTRLAALSHSPWDWDEAHFCSAVREYNVSIHQPHPPGFPLYVAAAKAARIVVQDEFHALRAVNLIASCLVFPLFYAMARAFRFPFRTSLLAALIFCFLPNVWYWGGTVMSDVTCLVLFLAAAAMLLRRESQWFYLAGSVLFAGAMLIRPQSVVLCYPWMVASWRRLREKRLAPVAGSALLIALLVIGGYWLAAHASSGWSTFLESARSHRAYVAKADSVLNPGRPPLMGVLADFLVDPFEAGWRSQLLMAFALAALIRPRRRHAAAAMTFVPILVVSWFFANPSGVSRMSLGYLPLHALFAAEGMVTISSFFTRDQRRAAILQFALAAAVVVPFVVWTLPALREVRVNDSPPQAAINWILQHAPRGSKIYYDKAFESFMIFYLGDYRTEEVPYDDHPRRHPSEPGARLLMMRPFAVPGAVNFVRARDQLWGLSHRRWFEASVVPLDMPKPAVVQFGSGWSFEEKDGLGRTVRWMGREGRLIVPPLGIEGVLTLHLHAPMNEKFAPTMTVQFNGETLETFRPVTPDFQRHYVLIEGGELVITVDRTFNPSRAGQSTDDRELGLLLRDVTWGGA